MGDEVPWIPGMTEFFKYVRRDNVFVANFNILLEDIIRRNFQVPFTSYFHFSPHDKVFYRSDIFRDGKTTLSKFEESYDLESITKWIMDANKAKNKQITFFTTLLNFQMIIALSNCIGNEKIKIVTAFKTGFDWRKCEIGLIPIFVTLNITNLIKFLRDNGKCRNPLETFTVALCVSGVNVCFNVTKLNVDRYLDEILKCIRDGKQLIERLEMGDDGSWIFNYNAMCKILSTCSKTRKVNRIKGILEDYEKLINDDLQI